MERAERSGFPPMEQLMNGTLSPPRAVSQTPRGADDASSTDRTRRWSFAANGGALVAAFLASACCVGPLVLALLGLGGGALLVKFEPYRPYLMAVTFVLLGLGFWLQYRKPKPVANANANANGVTCDCPTPRANKAGRVMLWVSTVLVVAFLVFPYIAPLIWD